ncbi:MAG: DNA-3-methyladenine glycosylase, partial [Chlamydiales bacterium]|nr:DNA-3-methyladenine glycosylase [Chlamydiales bacterium]
KRTEIMYTEGGVAYVYLCYGLYPLLNVVTNKTNIPHAVLIRAIAPTDGIELMQQRRKEKTPLADGPGMLTQALGITMQNNGQSFASSTLWIEAHKRAFKDSEIDATPRIGINYAEEHALLPWRFRLSKKFTTH